VVRHVVQKWQAGNVNRILWELFESSLLEDGTEGAKVNKSGSGSCPLAGFVALNLGGGGLLAQCWLGTSLRIMGLQFGDMSQASLGSKMTSVGWKSGF
jgi:hypothetical protein